MNILAEELTQAADEIETVDDTMPGYVELFRAAAKEIDELSAALTEAVKLIRQWHNMDTEGLLTQEEHEITWKIYQEKAPEMQRINAALAKGK